MIKRPKPERFRLRRTMMFMNAQNPGLIKDAYIYGCDSIMLDLEDAVAENQKDAARFSLYHALTTIDYGSTVTMQSLDSRVPATADLRISIVLPPFAFPFYLLTVDNKAGNNANILYYIFFIIF